MSTFSGLELGKKSLLSHQYALNVTGHNLSNLNTEGYTRQRAVLTSDIPLSNSGSPGQIGTGVTVKAVERIRNTFVDLQYRQENSKLGEWEQMSNILGQAEKIFLEPSDTGINGLLTNFWNSWQMLSSNPENDGARTTLIEEAVTLTTAVNFTYNKLVDLSKQVNTLVGEKVDSINEIAHQIADLNDIIVDAEAGGENANDLKDKRDLLMDELSLIVDIHSIEDTSGSVTVYIGGKTILAGDVVNEVGVKSNPLNNGYSDVIWSDTGFSVDYANGELQGLMTVRDQSLPEFMDGLNSMAIALIDRVNEVHQAGFGLDGTGGINFFEAFDTDSTLATKTSSSEVVSGPGALVTANTLNSAGFSGAPITYGDILINGQKFNISATTTVDEFMRQVNQNQSANVTIVYNEIADKFTITNNSDGAAGKINIYDISSTGIFDRMNVDISRVTFGTGDIYKITGDPLASGEYGITSLTVPINGDPLISDNENMERNPVTPAAGMFMINGVEVRYDADIDTLPDIVERINDSDCGVVADIDSRNRLVLRATEEYDYKIETVNDVRGDLLQKLGLVDTYDTPRNIIGDTLCMPKDNAAQWISVNTEIQDNIRLVAADAGSMLDSEDREQPDVPRVYEANGPGDGSNALGIAQLANQVTMNGNLATFNDYFDSMIGSLGSRSREAQRMTANETLLKAQFKSKREEISGISIDEEMSNMIRFQHGYNSAAKFIRTVDECLEQLMSLT